MSRFRPCDQSHLAPSGVRARAVANLEVVGLLRRLAAEDRPASPAEQARLARWGGWGALPGVFDPADTRVGDVRAELRHLLTPAEWEVAASTTLNAHYTDLALIDVLWAAAATCGVSDRPGPAVRVLEPGCGPGLVLAAAPDTVNWEQVGVELDPITAAVARHLVPDATIHTGPLEQWPVPPGGFDVVVGNVPFAKYAPYDPVLNADRLSLHNYALVKGVAALKAGGVLVAVTSHWTLDARNPAARRVLYERADLVGVVRLPSGAHRVVAGTEVVTDVVVLRRRRPGEAALPFDWETTRLVDTSTGAVRVNDRFAAHPEWVVGDLRLGDGPHGPGTLSVTPPPGADVGGIATTARAVLAGQIAAAVAAGYGWDPAPPAPPPQPPPMAVGPMAPGSLCVIGGVLVRLDDDGRPGPVARATRRRDREVRQLVELRDTARRLLAVQASADPAVAAQWEPLRERLVDLYDGYVRVFGPINRSRPVTRTVNGHDTLTWRSQLPTEIRNDPGFGLLAGLEIFDEQTQTAERAAIFHRRVVDPWRAPRGADGPLEALTATLAAHGRVDLDAVADLAAMPVGEILDALVAADRVYLDPATDRWVTAEAYLQGNVRHKLATAQAAVEAGRPDLARNVAALIDVLPPDLGAEQIYVGLGSAWVPTDVIARFVTERLGAPVGVTVNHSPTLGQWYVHADGWVRASTAASSQWGTARADAYDLLADALNRRRTEVFDVVRDDQGRERRVLNEEATVAALQKRAAMERAFTGWVFTDPARRDRLVGIYNERFNSLVEGRFDGSHLAFPGLSAAFAPIRISVTRCGGSWPGTGRCCSATRWGRARRRRL